MEIIGKLRQILPEQRGESQRGPWVRGGFVIDTIDTQYPRSISFSTWGEDILSTLKSIRLGDTIQVTFDIESREYMGRWYTDCRCRSIGAFVSNINGANQSSPYPPFGRNNDTVPQGGMQVDNNSAQSQSNEMSRQTSAGFQESGVSTSNLGGTISEDSEINGEDDDLPF
ncbi:MAG: DUF3127 domain-containing protein [Bacteroidales bacterium]|nr:DUF3127 domain-containing protein [Bacteroidales bacterium]